MLITKEFTFDSAHFLPNYHGKCENLHGHTYRLAVTFEGERAEDGLIMDFARVKILINECVIDMLDHHHLNDIIENPSAENIAVWIWDRIFSAVQGNVEVREKVKLYEVRIWETSTSSVRYRGT